MQRSKLRRQPILEAMIRVTDRKGYSATSVADVISEAGASRTTFYKYFDDKQDCFLTAYDVAVERVLTTARGGCDPLQSWPEGPLAGLAAVVDLFADDPALARTAVLEGAAAGSEAQRRRLKAIGRLAAMLEESGYAQDQPQLPDNTALMAVSGVMGLILDELQAGQASTLHRLLPELEFALLVPFLGPQAAVREMGRNAA